MEDRKKELLKKIATEFPALKESEKYYIAGYISHAEDARAEKMEVRTAQSARKESESVDKKDETEVKIHVDTTELVDAIEKANRLVCVLKEVNTLIHSLLGAEQSKT